jgi:SET domain-containing protein
MPLIPKLERNRVEVLSGQGMIGPVGSQVILTQGWEAQIQMPLVHSNLIEVRRSGKKGRGVFARQFIRKGTVIERAPIILLPVGEVFTRGAPKMVLADYVFKWGKDMVAVALGYGSLYNHSYQPNASYDSAGWRTQVFRAIRDIEAGEEITVNYNGAPNSRRRLGFSVEK